MDNRHARVMLYQWAAFIVSIFFAWYSDESRWLKAAFIALSWFHARWGLWFLDCCGLIRPFFQLDMLTGIDRTFLLGGDIEKHQDPVPVILCMEAPDDIDEFKKKIHEHFLSFRRCRQAVVQIGSEFFLQDVTDIDKLNDMVVIHGTELDQEGIQDFTAKILEHHTEIIEQRPALKIWLIPSKTNGQLFVVAKFYHFYADGLSIMQMVSLMQDGGDEVRYNTNPIRYPPRRPAPYCVQLADGLKSAELQKDATIPKTVLLNEGNVDYESREHKVHISKDFKVSDLKVKSRAMKVSLNDVFMGAVVKAIKEVSAHTKETKVVAFMPYSLYTGE